MEGQVQENKYLIPLAIVVAGALIAGAIYMGDKNGAAVANNNEPVNVEVPGVKDTDHIVGSRTAPVVIIEYSDTECPFCKNFHYTMKEILSDYGEDVAWVYRHLPIPQLHARAMKEAEATECVAELGGNQAFWSYLDKIFEKTNSNDSLDPAQLPVLAGEVGVNVDDFNSCLSSGKYTQAITASIEEGYEAGARGTPYSIIIAQDGRKMVVNGAEPIDMVKTKIDALLK